MSLVGVRMSHHPSTESFNLSQKQSFEVRGVARVSGAIDEPLLLDAFDQATDGSDGSMSVGDHRDELLDCKTTPIGDNRDSIDRGRNALGELVD